MTFIWIDGKAYDYYIVIDKKLNHKYHGRSSNDIQKYNILFLEDNRTQPASNAVVEVENVVNK